nr:STAS domain-containing protein [Caulobacter sp. RHG1]
MSHPLGLPFLPKFKDDPSALCARTRGLDFKTHVLWGRLVVSSILDSEVLVLENATISNIAVTYEIIASTIAHNEDVAIDVSSLSEVDLTFVQLIESARRAAAERGRTIRLRTPAQGALLQVLQRGGFLDPEDQERSDFWLQGTSVQ